MVDKILHGHLEREPALSAKVAHVTKAGQSRQHECHWPGCKRQVPPAMWGCRPHWFALPKFLRALVWDTYKPGQEIRMDPSPAYLDAANKVQRWIADKT